MPEPEKTKHPKSPEGSGKTKRQKAPKGSDGGGSSRTYAARVERSLKDVDRLLKKNPEASAHERAMAQLEQAKISALLQLAEAIRESKRAEGPPRA